MQAPSLTETPKQREVSYRLEQRGYPHGWRQYLVDRKAAGLSDATIAFELRDSYDLKLDPSAIGKWRRQAGQEISARDRTREKRAAEDKGVKETPPRSRGRSVGS